MAKTGRNPLTNTLEDAVQHREIWPTPTVGMVEGGEQSDRVEKTEKGAYILRKKNKPDSTFGAKLSDAILFEEKKKMWPTPTAHEFQQSYKTSKKRMEKYKKIGKATGGVRNLATEVQMWPTPRATNINESYETANKRMEKRKKEGRVTGGVRNLATEVQMWPTPRANNIVNKKERLTPEGRLSKDGKQKFGLNLQDAVTMWPTPTSQQAGKGETLKTLITKDGEPAKQGERAYNPKTGKHVQVTLDRAVTMWPTPVAGDAHLSSTKEVAQKRVKEGKVTLSRVVQSGMWPTPSASGARSEGMIKQMRKKVDQGELTQEEAEQMIGGSLNPRRLKKWTPKSKENKDK